MSDACRHCGTPVLLVNLDVDTTVVLDRDPHADGPYRLVGRTLTNWAGVTRPEAVIEHDTPMFDAGDTRFRAHGCER